MLIFLLNFFQAYGQALWSVPFLLLLCLAGAVCYLIYRDPVQAGSFLFYQLFRALPAGLLGSLLLVLAGIRAEAVTSLWLLPVSGILALWQPRFLCLAYSGSLLCLSRLVWGIPQVEPPQLMALVALLHVAEGLLVLTEKSKGLRPRLIPVACSGSRGKTLGEKRLPGYQKRWDLQRFWPLPLVLLTAARLPYAGLDGLWAAAAEMPGWWPLLGRELLEEAADPKGLGGDLFFVPGSFDYGPGLLSKLCFRPGSLRPAPGRGCPFALQRAAFRLGLAGGSLCRRPPSPMGTASFCHCRP